MEGMDDRERMGQSEQPAEIALGGNNKGLKLKEAWAKVGINPYANEKAELAELGGDRKHGEEE